MQANLHSLATALHLAADIVFVGGLLMASLAVTALSRESPQDLARHRRLVDGVRRWNRDVTTPALALAWLLGLWLAGSVGWFGAGWLTAKVVLVIVLSALHGAATRALRRLAGTPPIPPSRASWVAAPLALAAAATIVWLVLLKPF